MLKYLLIVLLVATGFTASSQSVAGMSFKHLYDPQNEANLALKLVNEKTQLTVYYQLQANSSDSYSITWTRFDTYTERIGVVIEPEDSSARAGKISFPVPDKQWLLIARVLNKNTAQSWRYIQVIDAKYPVNGYVEGAEGMVFKPYVFTGQEYMLRGVGDDRPFHVFYYKTDFPVASPPFSEKGAHMDRFMFADSSFQIQVGQKLVPRSSGLYLVQRDTAANEGFSFMAVSGAFPKLNKIDDIPDPLVFVCTQQEHDELIAAGNDKVKVDKVILDITRDKDRAKNFMRSYFRNVELANYYFSAFKDGWKTDRGMVYMIFGMPDEINKTGPNEVWTYTKRVKERFTFVKVGSVYAPNNFILQRSNKFAQEWFDTVDNWRKSRY